MAWYNYTMPSFMPPTLPWNFYNENQYPIPVWSPEYSFRPWYPMMTTQWNYHQPMMPMDWNQRQPVIMMPPMTQMDWNQRQPVTMIPPMTPRWNRHQPVPPRFLRKHNNRNETRARFQSPPCPLQPSTQESRVQKPYLNFLRYEKTKYHAVDPVILQNVLPTVINLFRPEEAGGSGRSIEVRPGERVTINTHVAFDFPPDKFGLIVDNKSVLTGKRLRVDVSVIDSKNREEICVTLENVSARTVEIFPGEVIAHMLLVTTVVPIRLVRGRVVERWRLNDDNRSHNNTRCNNNNDNFWSSHRGRRDNKDDDQDFGTRMQEEMRRNVDVGDSASLYRLF